MIFFPRKLWVEISQKEVDEQMKLEYISLVGKTEEQILGYIIARIEAAESNADRRAMNILLTTYGMELV